MGVRSIRSLAYRETMRLCTPTAQILRQCALRKAEPEDERLIGAKHDRVGAFRLWTMAFAAKKRARSFQRIRIQDQRGRRSR